MATRKPDRDNPEALGSAYADRSYPEASEDAYTDREELSRSDGDIRTGTQKAEWKKRKVNGNYITHDVKPVDSCGNVTQHEAVEGRTNGDCIVNEVTATNNKNSAERSVEGQTGQNVGKPSSTERTNADLSRQDMSSTEQSEVNLSRHGADSTEQSKVEKLNTFPQRMLLCSRCQAALRHKNIVRRTSVTENWTGTCSICKHLLYVGEYEVMDKTSAQSNAGRERGYKIEY